MNVQYPTIVKELYTLVDKCARVEEGRRLPGEEDGVDIDSEDDDEATSQKKKNKKRNKRCKDKALMTLKDRARLVSARRTRPRFPARKFSHALIVGKLRLPTLQKNTLP